MMKIITQATHKRPPLKPYVPDIQGKNKEQPDLLVHLIKQYQALRMLNKYERIV